MSNQPQPQHGELLQTERDLLGLVLEIIQAAALVVIAIALIVIAN
jgi:hypothetical protein